MDKNFGLKAAYYFVATGFTLWLIILFTAVMEFVKPSGTLFLPVNQVKISFPSLFKKVFTATNEGNNHVPDTLRISKNQEKIALLERPVPVIYQSLHIFKGSDIVPYQFMRIRALLWVLLWQILLYQLFLVLYDMKRFLHFTDKNVNRMKRAGYLFFGLFLLSAVTFEFTGFSLPYGGFALGDSKGMALSGNSLIYAAVGFLFLAFAGLFRKRTTSATEANKT